MISSSVFDVTLKAFRDFVNEVFSGTDENQKSKLRTKLNQFSKISNNERQRMPDYQISCIQVRKRRLSDVQNTLPPEMVEKILKFLTCRDICQAMLTCRRWKEITDKGNLLTKALGMTSFNLLFFSF